MCIGVIFRNSHTKNRVSFIEKTQFTCKNKEKCRNLSFLLEITFGSCQYGTSKNKIHQLNWGNLKDSILINTIYDLILMFYFKLTKKRNHNWLLFY